MKINLRNSVASAAAVTSLLLSSMAPAAFAADTTLIGGNGSGSQTSVQMNENHSNTVVQDNTASITNSVNSKSSTGGNVASGNTGGDVLLATGNSSQRVTIDNKANINMAQIGCSTCASGGSDTRILGNGSGSSNYLKQNANQSNSIFQTNDANFRNSVNLKSNTGENYASGNTGTFGGNSPVRILTGDAMSDVAIRNAANANTASMGGMAGAAGAGMGSGLDISGNGSKSRNSASLSDNHSNSIVQDNNASFYNHLTQGAITGNNFAKGNTGGDVLLGTGSTMSRSWLNNMANFNTASLDCGCVTGGFGARISGNGSYSDSYLTNNSNHSNSVFQTGDAMFNNHQSDWSNSGNNMASKNTGPVYGWGTTRVLSGTSMSDNYVSNQSNINSYGTSLAMPGGWGLSLGWDLGNLLGM